MFVFQYRWGDNGPSPESRRRKPQDAEAASAHLADVPYSEPGRTASQMADSKKSPTPKPKPAEKNSGPSFFENAGRGIGNAWRGFERIPKDINVSATLASPIMQSTPIFSSKREYLDPVSAIRNPKGGISPELHEGYRFKITVPAIRLGSSIFGNALLLNNAAQFSYFADHSPTAEEWGMWSQSAKDAMLSGGKLSLQSLSENSARSFAQAAVNEQYKNAPFKDKFGPHLGEALECLFMAQYFQTATSAAIEQNNAEALAKAQQGQRRAGSLLISSGLNFLTPTRKEAGAATYWLQSGMASLLASSGVAGLSGELLIGGKKDRGYLDLDAKVVLNPSATIPLTNFQLALNNTVLGMVEGAYHCHLFDGNSSKVNMKVGASVGLLFPSKNSQILVGKYEREGRSFGLQTKGLQGTTLVGNLDLGVSGKLYAGKTSSVTFDTKIGLPPALIARLAGGALSEALKERSPQYYENWIPPVGYDVAYRTQLGKALESFFGVGSPENAFFKFGATGVAGGGMTVDRIYAKIGYAGREGSRRRIPLLGAFDFPPGELSEHLVFEARGSPIKGLNLKNPLDNRVFAGGAIDYALDSGFRVFVQAGAEAMRWGENPVPTINVGIGFNLSPPSTSSNAVNPREF